MLRKNITKQKLTSYQKHQLWKQQEEKNQEDEEENLQAESVVYGILDSPQSPLPSDDETATPNYMTPKRKRSIDEVIVLPGRNKVIHNISNIYIS